MQLLIGMVKKDLILQLHHDKISNLVLEDSVILDLVEWAERVASHSKKQMIFSNELSGEKTLLMIFLVTTMTSLEADLDKVKNLKMDSKKINLE